MALYNLEYYVGKTKVETVMWNLPITLVKWKKKVLGNTSHRLGTLKIVKNDTKTG